MIAQSIVGNRHEAKRPQFNVYPRAVDAPRTNRCNAYREDHCREESADRSAEAGRHERALASNKPGRVALVCRIVSLRALAAFIATHPGAELVERHGAEHRDPLAEHPERHPHGALAALAPDPRVTFGLELGNGAAVCDAPSKRVGKRRYGSRSEKGSATALRGCA